MATRRQLEIFAEIVKQGSFRKAADALEISEVSVSKQIKALETACGCSFFLRNIGKPSQLTNDGLKILKLADEALAVQNKIRNLTSKKSINAPTEIIIRPYLMDFFLRPNLAKLHDFGFPKDISFNVVESTNEIMSRLRNHPESFALFRGNVEHRPSVNLSYLKESYVSVYVPTGLHDEIKAGKIDIEEIPFLTPKSNHDINMVLVDVLREKELRTPFVELPVFIDQIISEAVRLQAKVLILDAHAQDALASGLIKMVEPRAKTFWLTLASGLNSDNATHAAILGAINNVLRDQII